MYLKFLFAGTLFSISLIFISCQGPNCDIEGIYKADKLVRMSKEDLYYVNIIEGSYLTWTYRAGYLPDKKYTIQNDSIFLFSEDESFCLGYIQQQTCDSLIIDNHGTTIKFHRTTETEFSKYSSEAKWAR